MVTVVNYGTDKAAGVSAGIWKARSWRRGTARTSRWRRRLWCRRPVVDTIVGQGEKNLVQFTVDTTGLRPFWPADEGLKKPVCPPRPKRGVIIATDAHPFWVAGKLNKRVNASDLKPGMWLRTSAGTYVQVTATKYWTTHRQCVHNLTVADLHTYYVLAGTTPVLVHNDNEVPGWAAGEIARIKVRQGSPRTVSPTDPTQKLYQGRESARRAAK